MIITIDGPVGTGKSTIAKKLAKALGFIFFDTGAMYRAATYGLLKNNINIEDEKAVKKYLEETFDFDIKVKHGEKRFFLNNEDVTDAIRSDIVTKNVSKVAAIKPVREKMTTLQREFAKGVNAIFEGRDMGTTVFPNADLKIYLTGSLDVRAQRRYEELLRRFPEEVSSFTLEQVKENIVKRDTLDSTRKESPLRKAEDAYEIDTTDLSPDEVVFKILEYKDSLKKKKFL